MAYLYVRTETLGNVSAARRRPGFGRQAEQTSLLRAVLVVALENFVFRSEPVFGFVAWFESTALRQEVGEPADLLLQIDGDDVGSNFTFYD